MTGQRSNRERAAEAIREARRDHNWLYSEQNIAAELDAAEARGDATGYERGRADLAGKVGSLHRSDGALTPFCEECGHCWPCHTVRLVAEAAPAGEASNG